MPPGASFSHLSAFVSPSSSFLSTADIYDDESLQTSTPVQTVNQKDIMDNITPRVIFVVMYSIIFVIGVAGNSLVVYVVVRSPAMHTITNVFIANLAISDIIMCLLAVPFTPISGLLKSWVFGETLCHVVPMALAVSVHVSTLTSTAIAVERYFVIVHPFRPRMRISFGVALILAIWIVSISVSLPLAIYQEVIWDPIEDIYSCQEHWPKQTSRQFFTVISLVLQYVIPCTIISFCYISVSFSLRMRARSKIGSGRSNRDRQEMEIQRKHRTNKMLVAMVTIFVCCWLPLNVIHLILEYHDAVEHWNYFLLLFFVAHVIAMSSTIYNPLLYAGMNENFKKEFRQVLPVCLARLRCCCCCFCLRSTGDWRWRNGSTSSMVGGGGRVSVRGGRSASLYTVVDTQVPLASLRRASTNNGRCSREERQRALRGGGEAMTGVIAAAEAMYFADQQVVLLRSGPTDDDSDDVMV